MADSDMAVAGVQSCGCITYVNSEPDRLNGEDRKDLMQCVEAGGEERRATVGEIKAAPNFLPGECPHEPKGWSRR